MKQALLLVSFGTSVSEARACITAVENVLADTLPDAVCVRAFTSPTIRRILAGRGEHIFSLEEALDHLAGEGISAVTIQPTHLLYGIEYDKLKATADHYRPRFERLTLGLPLLADTQDLQHLASCLGDTYPRQEGQAVVLLGHGTEHFANAVYPAMQTAFRLQNRADVFIGTVEGWPTLEDVCKQLDGAGCRAVLLAPMMLVAGDHARNDMAGDGPDSWKSQLKQAGYTVECSFTGLGLLPGVQELYRSHLLALLGE